MKPTTQPTPAEPLHELSYYEELWQDLKTRPPLPEARPGDVTEWSPGSPIGTNERVVVRRARAVRREVAAEQPAATPPTAQRRRRQAASVKKCHPLLVGIKPFFEKTRCSETGILGPFKRLMADILSSMAGLDGAITAADRVFKGLTARGHRVVIAALGAQVHREGVDMREVARKDHYQQGIWSPERPTVVYIGMCPSD